jgi:hypothetical protein
MAARDPDGREELRLHVRDEEPPADAVVVVRGGPASAANLASHARRTHAAFTLDGQPLWGVSVACALDDIGSASLDGLLRRFASYPAVHLPTVSQLTDARFDLLPTFQRPHFTLRLASATEIEVRRLLAALGDPRDNPYHGGGRPGRRRR